MINWVECYGTKEEPHPKHIYHDGIKQCAICTRLRCK